MPVKKSVKSYVLDTSVVIEKKASEMINKGELKGTIILAHAVVSELEHQANKRQDIGFLGLAEIQTLQDLAKKKKIKLEFDGLRPTLEQIKLAKKGGEIDAIIRQIAYDRQATLITADRVQSESGKAFGLDVIFVETKKPSNKISFLKYFDKSTMSVHIREGSPVYAKRGKPGKWELKKLGTRRLDYKTVQNLAKEIAERSRLDIGSFLEIERRGSTVIQYQQFRIVIVRPPVANNFEITIVSPIKKLKLEDYKLPKQIHERLKHKARGVLIAGETGSGKSTFAQAVAEMYVKMNRIVKTVESPRDLSLSADVTQYSKNFADSEEIHDILFLSRPDNILFDEIRNTPDFELFTDLKLAGSNCMGVIHASAPIDAIQRFLGRLELGMIASVVDTILFIAEGKIHTIYVLDQKVKVPSGMVEDDLARPVVEVRDYLTQKLCYEIYSYGDNTVVMPVDDEEKKISPLNTMAEENIETVLKSRFGDIRAKIIGTNKAEIFVAKDKIPELIGKGGSNIDRLEKELGIRLSVKELSSSLPRRETENIQYKINEKGRKLSISVENKYAGKTVELWLENEFFFDVIVGKSGDISLNLKSPQTRSLIKGIKMNQNLEVKI